MPTLNAILLAFTSLESAGFLLPRTMETDEGLAKGGMVWSEVLHDVADEDFAAAVVTFMREAQARWWPTPGQLLQLVPGRRLAAIDDADDAWGQVCRLARVHGSYVPPELTMAQAVGVNAIGGWRAFCVLDEADDAAARAAFRNAYRGAKQRALMVADHPRLEGPGPSLLHLLPPPDEEPEP